MVFSAISANCNSVATEMMKKHLDGKLYIPAKASEWVENIGASIIAQLKTISPNFKYIVSSVIVQKLGAGIHNANTSLMDSAHDGLTNTKYENDSMVCLCTIIGCSMN